MQQLCSHQLFEAQARLRPSATAVQSAAGRLTYAELDERAERLAAQLRARGVGAEVLVGLCAERSNEMVVGLLAILKAGGAYVPLDPGYPRVRLDFMIEDVGLSVIVVQEKLDALLPGGGVAAVYLDRECPALTEDAGQNRGAEPHSASLAYVIYTSGSTGRPKGVMVEHGSLTNFIEGANARYGVRAGDRVLQFSSISFDAAVEEIFLALTTGATLVLRPDPLPSAAEFLRGCGDLGITVLDLPTGYWHELVWEMSEGRLRLPESIRLVIIGGERALPERVAEWHRCAPRGVTLMNGYGPTETTVAVTVADLSAHVRNRPAARQVPIGFPLDKVQMHLLGGDLRPVAEGEAGELCVGGGTVARGYLNRPELTAERFIPDPFRPGSRLYRTGDFARRLPDGQLEFLGREDEQVKLRGYRVELGEVEAALRQHPSVRAAAVVARADAAGDVRLIAYVVREDREGREPDDLRAFIAGTLPDFMRPAVFIEVDALPLSPSGKIDRDALPSPDGVPAGEFSAPLGETERRLAALWEDVFNFRPVGRDDNFFELGGHSLLAVRLFARVGKEFGVHLPLSTLFQAPTVGQLAGFLRRDDPAPKWSSLVEIQPRGDRPPFFCVHAVGGNVLEYHELARHLGPRQPFYGLQSYGLHPEYEPHTGVEQMAALYVEEMRRLQPRGPYFLGGRSLGGIIAYEMACRLLARGERVALLALLDTYPYNYRRRVYGGASLTPRLVIERARRHLLNLRRLPAVWRLPYVLSKFAYGWRGVRSRAWQAAYDLHQTFGGRLPARLRDIEQFNFMAARNYTPPLYPGKVTLFWASSELRAMHDCREGWALLAAGGVEVREIPGDHINIIKEPYVRALAAELEDCLEHSRADAEVSGRDLRRYRTAGGVPTAAIV